MAIAAGCIAHVANRIMGNYRTIFGIQIDKRKYRTPPVLK